MDVLVMLEESPDHSPVLAHVNSAPSPLTTERPARDIVTLYGVPNVELLALALAAAGVALLGYLLNLHVAARAPGGLSQLLSVGELRALYVVLGVALALGMRFAFSSSTDASRR